MAKIITADTLAEWGVQNALRINFTKLFPDGSDLKTACLELLKQDTVLTFSLLTKTKPDYMTLEMQMVKLKFALWLLKDKKWGVINSVNPELKDVVEFINNVAFLIQNSIDGDEISPKACEAVYLEGLNLLKNHSDIVQSAIRTGMHAPDDSVIASYYAKLCCDGIWFEANVAQKNKLLELLGE